MNTKRQNILTLVIIPFIIILYSLSPLNQIDIYRLKSSLPSIWNEIQITVNSIINTEMIFKVVKGEIMEGPLLIDNDVLSSESLQVPFKLAENVTSNITTNPITSDHFQGNRTLGDVGWINEHSESLSISIERKAPIYGNASLRVDVQPADVGDKEINDTWSGITTEFIAINNATYYNYTLEVSAKDVDNLHSIAYYYDKNKNGIKEDYIFHGTSGNFHREFNNIFLSPIEAKYLKIQFWLRPSIGQHSSYLLDNIGIAAIPVGEMQNKPVPTIRDSGLKIETVTTGLEFPTSMAFLGSEDILVLEKNKGTVRRIVNGNLLPEPLLDVNVGTMNDRGMLGIAVSDNTNVFIYFTETSAKDGSDVIGDTMNESKKYESKEPLGNRLYKYKLDNNTLTSPKLLVDIPAKIRGEENIGIHNGGKVRIGPDENVYLVVGDIGSFRTKTQNILNDLPLNATSVVLRISQQGEATGYILGSKDPINKFYAYGIRNSFGMDFDPLTGNLWDTENGDYSNDEINLIKPGFNSGWSSIMGMSKKASKLDLVNFGGRGNYSDPEFVWLNNTVSPTALKFLNSEKLDKNYKFDMFVGDFNNGYLYHFDLNEKRTELTLNGVLKDKIADNQSELKNIIIAEGFGGITDIEVGPDGYLYILTLEQTNPQAPIKCNAETCSELHKYSDPIRGSLYRIVPIDG